MSGYFSHRGLFDNERSIPENSLIAFKKSIEKGYGIELDLSLSSDLKCVVFHDKNMYRMCAINHEIGQYSSTELKDIKLLDTSETIPSLQDVLNLVNQQAPLMIELKTCLNRKEMVELFIEEVKNYKGPFCVVSFDPYILWELKKQAKTIIRGQIVQNFMQDKNYSFIKRFILSYSLMNVITRPDFISYNYRSLNTGFYLYRFLKGFVSIWPISSQESENNFQKQANLIIFEHYLP